MDRLKVPIIIVNRKVKVPVTLRNDADDFIVKDSLDAIAMKFEQYGVENCRVESRLLHIGSTYVDVHPLHVVVKYNRKYEVELIFENKAEFHKWKIKHFGEYYFDLITHGETMYIFST